MSGRKSMLFMVQAVSVQLFHGESHRNVPLTAAAEIGGGREGAKWVAQLCLHIELFGQGIRQRLRRFATADDKPHNWLAAKRDAVVADTHRQLGGKASRYGAE